MACNSEKYGISDEMAPIGTWLVYIAYLIILVAMCLSLLGQSIGDVNITTFFLLLGFVIFVFIIFLVAPVLQIIGFYSLWIKKSSLGRRHKIKKRLIACGAYFLNFMAFACCVYLIYFCPS